MYASEKRLAGALGDICTDNAQDNRKQAIGEESAFTTNKKRRLRRIINGLARKKTVTSQVVAVRRPCG